MITFETGMISAPKISEKNQFSFIRLYALCYLQIAGMFMDPTIVDTRIYYVLLRGIVIDRKVNSN